MGQAAVAEVMTAMESTKMVGGGECGGEFEQRHIGPTVAEQQAMLKALGETSLDAFINRVVPQSLRTTQPLKLKDFPIGLSEHEMLLRLRSIANKNQVYRSFIGMGYSDCLTPPVIQRNILENPGWYTQYTPYQPEISQGRLEALLNFQTMITDLTGMAVANASLLDEATAAAEAVNVAASVFEKHEEQAGRPNTPKVVFVSELCHPQTIAVVKTRAAVLGIEVRVGDHRSAKALGGACAAVVQYPDTFGSLNDYAEVARTIQQQGGLLIVAADLLALTVLRPPSEFGADIVVGSAQRFGVPLGFGGPHAAFFAVKDEYKRLMPGRLVGVSKDSHGKPALRLSLQTREQHIRREKATSNICTAQVLLAIMASMYAVYHGPAGLQRIARRVHGSTAYLAKALTKAGLTVETALFFDTIVVRATTGRGKEITARAEKARVNLRLLGADRFGVSLDETTAGRDLATLIEVFTGTKAVGIEVVDSLEGCDSFARSGEILVHPIFRRYHSETEFQRYVRKLESRDLSLTASMIPLGSCTMKLNAAAEMFPVTWREFGGLHPFAPAAQRAGYEQLFRELEGALADVTGFDAVSLQPNAGSQGEYAGLLAIVEYHRSRGDSARNVCLIPKSAHGTNPASAVMVGLNVVAVECDEQGNVRIDDLREKALKAGNTLAALMMTYPSTHGVFETTIREAAEIVHGVGGQLYMDGANLNAQVGLMRPAELGADVCHINLHKTFCIPHGGGGPGMGPIACRKHLAPFLPNHPVVDLGMTGGTGPVSAAPWGSASILPISWAYLAMMGGAGATRATKVAILNANYLATQLEKYYPVVYRGQNGFVAHECIIDLRPLKKLANVEVDDVAKRLMDYGFHAPTVSWPVPGTMMVEPTESEPKAELDRFIAAMIAIYQEAEAIAAGTFDAVDNPLKNAPHTAAEVIRSDWSRPYSREVAAFPSPATRDYKFWPSVGRIDASYGDRNLVCSCLPMTEY